MPRGFIRAALLVVAAVCLTTPGPRTRGTARSWLVLGEKGTDQARLVAAVEDAAGTVLRVHPQIGLVVASSTDASFAARLSGVRGVAAVGRDVSGARVDGATCAFGVAGVGPTIGEDAVDPPGSDDDPYFSLQWPLAAIHAPEAWETGATGSGVRVAVLDTGINPNHVDLAPNVDQSLCTSFVPGESWNVMVSPNPGYVTFAHGTHVAGTIAAADNGVGVIGVAPDAEIVAVKVLSQYSGYGTWSQVIDGLLYAADIDADVINMSLGGTLERHGGWDDNGTADPSDDVWYSADDAATIVNALSSAVSYAHAKGCLIVASAGNDANDGDHDADHLILPAALPFVISVSATTPVGWAQDSTVSLDDLASYSNTGRSDIDLAAPGGDSQAYPAPLWYYDYVINCVPLGWSWFAGTSMAAPHVSGVAALVIGQNPDLTPSQVESILRQTADDLGTPGRDEAYGHGRVNAYEAVR